MLKRCWYILMCVCPYLVMAGQLFLVRLGMTAWLCGWIGVTLLTMAGNLFAALKQTDRLKVLRLGRRAKLVHLPACAMTLLFVLVPPMLLSMLVVNTCMMITTSAYTLRGVYLAWREKTLSNSRAAAWAVSQCVFLVDTAGSIALYEIEKRRSK